MQLWNKWPEVVDGDVLRDRVKSIIGMLESYLCQSPSSRVQNMPNAYFNTYSGASRLQAKDSMSHQIGRQMLDGEDSWWSILDLEYARLLDIDTANQVLLARYSSVNRAT